MDVEHARMTTQKLVSVIQEDDYMKRVISRNSSVGCSSRVFYYRSSEGVPFKWEMQPGTPKDPQKEDAIPPLSPPPAILSLGLPTPCILIEEPKPSVRFRLKIWKHIKKLHLSRQSKSMSRRSNVITDGTSSPDKFDRLEFYSSDGDFMTSPRKSISSTSSSLLFSNSNGHSIRSSRLESPARETRQGPYGCGPWSVTSVLVSLIRRN
ncbi:hypothetical protein K2173_017359 [Erythroxylum novogranatense]|uniref:Uncharacterized protein n=1 Tax=Erythroxylum novogranatense TaxID=1862640 RepID=A0AAV8TM28_9ROSI|nr:hypothetical protein K2173_017359 [Erythroxylum novogranatense]